MIIVRTNEELSAAKEQKAEEIVIVGELAEKVKMERHCKCVAP